MHLSLATAVSTAASSLLIPAGTPASGAAAGLIGEPLRREELLFADSEDKNCSTIPTRQVFV
jgi:hypothetical protein